MGFAVHGSSRNGWHHRPVHAPSSGGNTAEKLSEDRFESTPKKLTKRERRELRKAEKRAAFVAFSEPQRAAAVSTTPFTATATISSGIDRHSSDLEVSVGEHLAGTISSTLQDEALLSTLRQNFKPKNSLSYGEAREQLFSYVDNDGGAVRCFYTAREVKTDHIPDAGGKTQMNTEHSFPKSWLHHHPQAITDLHHLFPTDTHTNSMRSSYAFGDVVNVEWVAPGGTAKLGKDAEGHTVFEPPPEHKGNIARALFYISTIYGFHLSAQQENVLRQWHEQDPVDDGERARNGRVAKVQGNRNPFVDAPELVKRISDF